MPATAKPSDALAKAVQAELDARFGDVKKFDPMTAYAIVQVIIQILGPIIQAWLDSKKPKPAK